MNLDELEERANRIAAQHPSTSLAVPVADLLAVLKVARAAGFVGYSNGFDAAYPDKLAALRDALGELSRSGEVAKND